MGWLVLAIDIIKISVGTKSKPDRGQAHFGGEAPARIITESHKIKCL